MIRLVTGGAELIGIAARLAILDGHQIVNFGAPTYTVDLETKRR